MSLTVIRNDITRLKVDAIVNAANNSLLGGGGVDGAIHAAAGKALLEECKTLGGCRTGEAKITSAYNLPSKYVIHTVGPIWRDGEHNERVLLESCYNNSLALAVQFGCKSVAFPLISGGVYGYPKSQAFKVAVDTIKKHPAVNKMAIYIVLFDADAMHAGSAVIDDIKEYIDDVYADSHFEQSVRLNPDFASDYVPDIPPLCSPSIGAPLSCPNSFQSESVPGYAQDDLLEEDDLQSRLNMLDESFSQMLIRLIDERHMTDPECYKKANVDRKLFSKIKNNPTYKPSKITAVSFVIALELDIATAREMLAKAGYAFSHSDKFDIIVEYFIIHRVYDFFTINEALFEFDQQLIGA